MREIDRAVIALMKLTKELYGFKLDEENNEFLANVMLNNIYPLHTDDKYIYQKRYYYKKKFIKLLEYAR